MNLALKDIRHGLFRFVLTCFGLGLLMTVVLAMIGIYNGLVSDALAVVKAPAWPMSGWWRPAPRARSRKPPASPPTRATRWRGCPAWPRPARSTTRTSRRLMLGARCGSMSSATSRAVPAGRRRSPRGAASAPAISNWWPTARPALLPGETIRLGRNRFTVVGLVEGAMNSGGDPAVYVTLADAMALQTELDPAAQRVQAARGAVPSSPHRSPPSSPAWRRRRCRSADRDRAPVEAPRRHDPGRTGGTAAGLGGRQGAPPDRAVPRHPAFRQRRGDRADHLHDDHGEAEADRHA
jgi:hypothetical protein